MPDSEGTAPNTRRVAVTVFVDADGLDPRDSTNIAVMAVSQNLPADGTITVRIPSGLERTARVVGVVETGAALRSGSLSLTPRQGA